MRRGLFLALLLVLLAACGDRPPPTATPIAPIPPRALATITAPPSATSLPPTSLPPTVPPTTPPTATVPPATATPLPPGLVHATQTTQARAGKTATAGTKATATAVSRALATSTAQAHRTATAVTRVRAAAAATETALWAPPPPPAGGSGSGGRVGAICRDGTRSYATGRGACSHHGGVDHWLYGP